MDNMLSAETNLALLQASQIQEPNRNLQRIEESARDFEAVFISEMMKPMFEGIKTDGLFQGGKGEEIFRSIMLQEYGKEIASLDVIGIQTQVKNKLIELQAARTAEDMQTTQNKQNAIDIEFTEK